MNLDATEEVDLFASESNFALGMNCENNMKEKYELLDLKSRYVQYVNRRDDTSEKKPKYYDIHRCT